MAGRDDKIQHVGEHARVGFNLLVVAPASDEIRLLVERRIDDMGNALQPAKLLSAGLPIGQVQLQEPSPGGEVRLAAAHRDHLAAILVFKRLDHGAAHQPQGADHQILPLFPNFRHGAASLPNAGGRRRANHPALQLLETLP